MLATLGRLLQRVGSRLAPQIRNEALYPAATQGRRARGWHAPTVGANDAVLGNLRTLRDRSRAGVRSDGYARTTVDRLVSNIVGSGIAPQSKAPEPEFRARLHQLFLDWTDEADADGRLDFYGLQALAVRGWLEGGEMFARLRARRPEDGLVVPLQLQLLEPEFCPIEHSVVAGPNRIRAGVEFSPIGRRAAYWFYRSRPGEQQDLDTSQLVRVPAADVVHLYDPIRAGQIRGLPQLTQALLKLHDLEEYDDATLLRQKLANLFTAFLTRTGPPTDAEVDPLTGQTIEPDDAGRGLLPLEPGIFQELAAGEDVTFSDPPEALGYADFMRAQLMGAAVAADVPYEVLTGDMRGVNDRTVRVVLNEFRRRIEQRQHHIVAFMFNRPVWVAFIERAVLSGALDVPAAFFVDPRPWMRVEWVPPAWAYLHPVQEVDAYKGMVRAGAMTLDEFIREVRGRSLEEVARERADELKLLDDLGIVTDTDPRKVSNAGLTQARPEGTELPDTTS